jgi:hypothetical protein
MEITTTLISANVRTIFQSTKQMAKKVRGGGHCVLYFEVLLQLSFSHLRAVTLIVASGCQIQP